MFALNLPPLACDCTFNPNLAVHTVALCPVQLNQDGVDVGNPSRLLGRHLAPRLQVWSGRP
jgi:hypothetical protein